KRVNQYSLGMKQRLGIAAALMGRPRLLLLDEPTNGLDPAGIQEMRALVKSLPARYGMTVLVSSHMLSEIDQMAEHVGVIRKGALVFQDSLKSLHSMSAVSLALRTTDNTRAAALVPAARPDGEWLLLPSVKDAEAARLSLRLAREQIGVVRMEQREKSLEDIFLALTGGEG
ncbi:MAG: ABC transporter ATP-binding protein, partial [Clostridiales bacterium]|nr:ABC transporter ATP-binding protein [Clostridiales bacterium]